MAQVFKAASVHRLAEGGLSTNEKRESLGYGDGWNKTFTLTEDSSYAFLSRRSRSENQGLFDRI